MVYDKAMQLRFNQKKTTQAAARFLTLAGGRMNYMKLIKLLYLTDRGALLRWGRPVSGDRYYLMKLGPVLTEVHDLITEVPCPGEKAFWRDYISSPSDYEVQLKDDPGNDELSRAEERLIDEIFAAYGHYAPFDLVEFLHKTLPEWKEIKSGRLPLEYREILQLGGIPPEAIEDIESELDNVRLVSSVLHSA
ncbi:MAG TPA: Panacea domain-containing protein [Terriglobia bacterium]|nr:Panacea domain-containing protein [Terriglobia bacterium]